MNRVKNKEEDHALVEETTPGETAFVDQDHESDLPVEEIEEASDYKPDFEEITDEEFIEAEAAASTADPEPGTIIPDKQELSATPEVITVVEKPRWNVPTLDEYLSAVDDSLFESITSLINKFEVMLDKQERGLFEYFDLVDRNDFISQHKKQYLQTNYNPTVYKDLLSKLYITKNTIENSLIRELTNAYYEVTKNNLEQELEESLTIRTKEISAAHEAKLEADMESLEKQIELDKARIEKRQREELEHLTKRHEDEIFQFEHRIEAERYDKKNLLNTEAAEKIEFEEIKLKEEFELKAQRVHFEKLIEHKNQEFNGVSSTVVSYAEDIRKLEADYLDLVKNNLMGEIPRFEELFEKYKKEEMERELISQKNRELAIQEKEIQLKEKSVENLEEKEKSLQKKEMEITNILSGILHEQNTRGSDMLQTQTQLFQMLQNQQAPNNQQQMQPQAVASGASASNQANGVSGHHGNGLTAFFSKGKSSMLPLILVGAVFGGGLIVHALTNDSHSAAPSAPAVAETTATVDSMDNNLELSNVAFESTYEELVAQGSYIEAAMNFPERSNELIEKLYIDEDEIALEQVIRVSISDYGTLFLSLLQNDTDVVLNNYEALDDELKAELALSHKQAVATHYLMNDQEKEAKELLE